MLAYLWARKTPFTYTELCLYMCLLTFPFAYELTVDTCRCRMCPLNNRICSLIMHMRRQLKHAATSSASATPRTLVTKAWCGGGSGLASGLDGKAGSEEGQTPGERAGEDASNDGNRRWVSGRRAELFVLACLCIADLAFSKVSALVNFLCKGTVCRFLWISCVFDFLTP
jgi:hypothetical protein